MVVVSQFLPIDILKTIENIFFEACLQILSEFRNVPMSGACTLAHFGNAFPSNDDYVHRGNFLRCFVIFRCVKLGEDLLSMKESEQILKERAKAVEEYHVCT